MGTLPLFKYMEHVKETAPKWVYQSPPKDKEEQSNKKKKHKKTESNKKKKHKKTADKKVERKVKKCYFVHIPKSGGRSLARHAQETYDHTSMVWVADIPELEAIHGKGIEYPQRWHWIGTHIGGNSLHRIVGEEAAKEYERCTILRDPLETAVSVYNYLMTNPPLAAGWDVRIKRNNLSINDFIRTFYVPHGGPQSWQSNMTQRILTKDCGEAVTLCLEGKISKEDYKLWVNGDREMPESLLKHPQQAGTMAEAKEMLDSCWVGINERFPETTKLFSTVYGWNHAHGALENVSKKFASVSEVTSATRKLLERVQEGNYELYEYAYKIHLEQCEEFLPYVPSTGEAWIAECGGNPKKATGPLYGRPGLMRPPLADLSRDPKKKK